MATRNIVPRANGEGQLGTAILHWSKLFVDAIYERANLGNNASLGYRQPSTAYTAGAIKYHASLPTGWYLECTTTGTSGSGDLSISSPAIGSTVSDGTVAWKISRSLSVNGGTLIGGGINRINDTSYIGLYGATSYLNGAHLLLHGKGSNPAGGFVLNAADGLGNMKSLRGLPNETLTWGGNDLAGSAIVAKSLDANGYIKYASGLILQWGWGTHIGKPTVGEIISISLPVSFTSTSYKLIISPRTNDYWLEASQSETDITTAVAKAKVINVSSATSHNFYYNWFAIGY